jgi:hypothetical protein
MGPNKIGQAGWPDLLGPAALDLCFCFLSFYFLKKLIFFYMFFLYFLFIFRSIPLFLCCLESLFEITIIF